MPDIHVRHRLGSYTVRFLSLSAVSQRLADCSHVLTDENVAQAHPQLAAQHAERRILEPGEQSKSLAEYANCQHWLAQTRAHRKSTLAAVGGGVIGDLGGFVAATYMRGIGYLQVPTTLLAQVDSSVGGKVAVDLEEGKNLVGAFYPPTEVLVAVEALATLPKRQFTNGMAEVLKYGFILEPTLLDHAGLTAESPDLDTVVHRCIQLKKEVVEADELETTGLRAILNFGHTVGHALEVLSGYGPLLHGEAIAIGMVVEARLGELLGITPAGTTAEVRERLRQAQLPTSHDLLAHSESLIQAMRTDKKATAGRLAFSLLEQVGKCKLVDNVESATVEAALKEA